MEFGHIEQEALVGIDFTLPADSEYTNKTLAASKHDGSFQIHVGCSKWGNKGWIGRLYPTGTKEKQFLNEYCKQFNAIELNSSFYVVPKPDEVKKWKDQVEERPDFKFCPRFPQAITHARRLKNAEGPTRQFYESIEAFGDKLGALILQVGEFFTPKSFSDMKTYLEKLPKKTPVFLEVRNEKWFAEANSRQSLFDTLHELNIGAVITDAAGRRDCAHMELPTPHALIRFVGNNLHPTDYSRADAWVERIKEWKDKGLRSVWFFVHEYDETYSPEMCDYFIRRLNERLDLELSPPRLIKD